MRRSLKYGVYVAVLAGVLGGVVAWVNIDKTVTVTVDGQAHRVHTDAGNVAGALSDAGFKVGPHDLVAPQPQAHIHGGTDIVLKRGRLLRLDVDGKARDIWVTAPTVADALAQLGYTDSDFASVSRDKRLPLSPTDIELRTPKTVTITVDGSTRTVDSVDATVSPLLAQLGIKLAAKDRMSVKGTAALADGMHIVIQRVVGKNIVVRQAIPFTTSTANDPTVLKGQQTVATEGKNGVAQLVYAGVYVDGKLVGKTLVKKTVLTPPTTKVIKVGTKVPPPPAPPPVTVTPPAGSTSSGTTTGTQAPPSAPIVVDPGSAQAIAQQMAAARGWGDDQFSCLVQMWDRESGWRVDAANSSGAYGIPQALPGSKMAAFGADWQTNPATQIAWGLSYIAGRYGTPCGAWSSWQANGWY